MDMGLLTEYLSLSPPSLFGLHRRHCGYMKMYSNCALKTNDNVNEGLHKIADEQRCRFCLGTGSVTVELGGDEKEVSRCINCDGVGSLTCTTCQGSGIQPRYLDRREFKDDD